MSLVSEIKQMIKEDKKELAKWLKEENKIDFEQVNTTYVSDVYHDRVYLLERVLKLING